jgi:FAD/FMN-containing dehydrogenase
MGGAQQFGYGRPRGSVIGMKVVLASGDVIRIGGRVVKNVAGYDLCKLFTGSLGSLGIITEVNFKLRPRPEREATVITRGKTTDLLSSARTILDARLFPVAAEIVSPAFADLLNITTPDLPVLLIRFAGNHKAVDYQVGETVAALENPEVISDDHKLWEDVSATGIQCNESIWQMGALDGRVSMLRQSPPALDKNAIELMRRVKQQLDPRNIFPDILSTGEPNENTSHA